MDTSNLPGEDSPHQGTDLCFSCSRSSGLLIVTAFDIVTGTVLKTYRCDSVRKSSTIVLGVGSASGLCLCGRNYLLCASNTVPFIYVWNLKKVKSMFLISIEIETYL